MLIQDPDAFHHEVDETRRDETVRQSLDQKTSVGARSRGRAAATSLGRIGNNVFCEYSGFKFLDSLTA
ncbi:hypothetical protein ACJZ2D_007934 [Fusarium nematophilum]